MKEGPDISQIAALIGDPARANILTALMSGKALTASELATEAGLTRQTVSSHLRKLEAGGLTVIRQQGRHRYVTLSGDDVAGLLETLMGVAAGRGHLRLRTGPKDPDLRNARVCYNHLAGTRGVQMFRAMRTLGCFSFDDTGMSLTSTGRDFVAGLGVDLAALEQGKSPLCRECLDWSARQTHLAGRLGRGLLAHFEQLGWVTRHPDSRIIRFSGHGQNAFDATFPPI